MTIWYLFIFSDSYTLIISDLYILSIYSKYHLETSISCCVDIIDTILLYYPY